MLKEKGCRRLHKQYSRGNNDEYIESVTDSIPNVAYAVYELVA